MAELDKRKVLEAFKSRLEQELERAIKRAREAASGVTHEENRAEGDKDMRATEASYVARGQASRVAEMEEAVTRLAALELLEFAPDARIALSALVELEHNGRRLHYFLLPAGGGEKVSLGGVEIQALTTQSPLGRALLGLIQGDVAELPTLRPGEPERVYEVLRVR
jgi:transcription elongation GreA/GreB family factor